MAYSRLGKAEEGKAALKQARDAAPNLPEAAAAQKVLAETSRVSN
jgi:hypothetical protein